MRLALSAFFSLALLLGGCSAQVRPKVLDEATLSSQTPKAKESAELAPASFAEAEQLRRAAEKAYNDGDPQTAALLAETAIAAYERAFAHARIVKAERLKAAASENADAVATELASLATEQAKVTAALRDLETRIKVVLDAQPIYTVTPANDPGREKARRDAAKALLVESRLLCVAARLLAPDASGISDSEKALSTLQTELADTSKPAPIDTALRTRAACLTSLTAARRVVRAKSTNDGADTLLSELSKNGSFSPLRDDRGVVVTIATPFSGISPSPDCETKLATLAKVAAAHKDMPMLAVIHTADTPATGSDRDETRGTNLKQILLREGAPRVEIVQAGTSRPIVDVKQPADKLRNERLEIVFVDNGG